MQEYYSKNLVIRELNLNELSEEMIEWFQDSSLMRFYTNSKNKISLNSLKNSIINGKKNNDNFTFGIYFQPENKLIGTLKLGPINKVHLNSDLVVLIGDKDFHGKGLAVEAISLGNNIAFNGFGIRKLFGGMYQDNISSIKSYTRAGWIVEGILKGHYFVNDKPQNRVLVGCFNPLYFNDNELVDLKKFSNKFLTINKLI